MENATQKCHKVLVRLVINTILKLYLSHSQTVGVSLLEYLLTFLLYRYLFTFFYFLEAEIHNEGVKEPHVAPGPKVVGPWAKLF